MVRSALESLPIPPMAWNLGYPHCLLLLVLIYGHKSVQLWIEFGFLKRLIRRLRFVAAVATQIYLLPSASTGTV